MEAGLSTPVLSSGIHGATENEPIEPNRFRSSSVCSMGSCQSGDGQEHRVESRQPLQSSRDSPSTMPPATSTGPSFTPSHFPARSSSTEPAFLPPPPRFPTSRRATSANDATGVSSFGTASPATLRSMVAGSLTPPLIQSFPPSSPSSDAESSPFTRNDGRIQSGGQPRAPTASEGTHPVRRPLSSSFDESHSSQVYSGNERKSEVFSPVVVRSRPDVDAVPHTMSLPRSNSGHGGSHGRSPLSQTSPTSRRRATICGTPTRPSGMDRGGGAHFSGGFVSPIKTSPSAHTLPPSAESMIVLRKVVELYGKAVEAKASVDPTVAALTTAAKEDMLRFVVLSPSWASVAASALARTLILFAEVFGSGHASLANVWKLQGLLAVQIGDFATGQTAFMAALSLCSDAGVDVTITAGLQFNLGVCCSMAGDYAMAVKHFRAASGVYVEKHGKDHELTRQTDEKLQQALRCGMQEQYTSLYSAALRAVSERRYADAHTTLEKCLELVPEEPTTAYSLAACCCRLHCCGGGISWFQKALEWGFDDWATALHDPDLAPLRAQPVFHSLLHEAGVDIHSSDEDVDVD